MGERAKTVQEKLRKAGASWRSRAAVMGVSAHCSGRAWEQVAAAAAAAQHAEGQAGEGLGGMAAGSAGTLASFSRRDTWQLRVVYISLVYCQSLVPKSNRY